MQAQGRMPGFVTDDAGSAPHVLCAPFYHAATLALVRAGSAEGLWRCSLMRAFSRRAAAARGVLGGAVIPGLRGKDPWAPAEAP